MARSERRRTRSRRPAQDGDRQQRAGTATGQPANGAGGSAGTPASLTTTAAPRPTAPKRGFSPFGWLKRFRPRAVTDVVSELRKVTWPTASETRYLTIVVSIVAVTVGIILGLFDLAFGWAIETVFFD